MMNEIQNGLEGFGKMVPKDLNDMRRFVKKCLSGQDFVESMKDCLVFGAAVMTANEYSEKEYQERGSIPPPCVEFLKRYLINTSG